MSPAIACAHDALVSTADLKPSPDNPNRHSKDQLSLYAKILLHQGWRKSLIVSNQSGFIVTGHGAWLTAKAQGWPECPVDYQDFASKADEVAHMIADNKLAQMAELDDVELARVIKADLAGTELDLSGLSVAELVDLKVIEPPALPDAEPQIDRAAELQKKWQTARGQLWALGEHLLLCGDSTNAEDVARVMDGEKAALCLTDPPYGIGENYSSFEDSKKAIAELIGRFLPLAKDCSEVVLLTPGNAHQRLYPNPTWILAWFVPAGTGCNVWGFGCWTAIFAYGDDPFLKAGLGSRPDALVMTETAEKNGHPCPKPIGVWSWMLERASVQRGDLVFDPFSGSGTTLMAAEQLGRRARCIEIDPGYCAVTLQRWSDATGKTPTLLP